MVGCGRISNSFKLLWLFSLQVCKNEEDLIKSEGARSGHNRSLNVSLCGFPRDSRAVNTIGPRGAVGNVSDYRYVSDCRSSGREFDPSPVPYFRGYLYEIISTVIILPSAGFFAVKSESICTKYWLTLFKLTQEKTVVRLTDRST